MTGSGLLAEFLARALPLDLGLVCASACIKQPNKRTTVKALDPERMFYASWWYSWIDDLKSVGMTYKGDYATPNKQIRLEKKALLETAALPTWEAVEERTPKGVNLISACK